MQYAGQTYHGPKYKPHYFVQLHSPVQLTWRTSKEQYQYYQRDMLRVPPSTSGPPYHAQQRS